MNRWGILVLCASMRLATVFGIGVFACLNCMASRELLVMHGWLARCSAATVLNLLRVLPQCFQRQSTNAKIYPKVAVSVLLLFVLYWLREGDQHKEVLRRNYQYPSRRCCQTNANQSHFSSNLNPLGYAKTASLDNSGGAVQLKI